MLINFSKFFSSATIANLLAAAAHPIQISTTIARTTSITTTKANIRTITKTTSVETVADQATSNAPCLSNIRIMDKDIRDITDRDIKDMARDTRVITVRDIRGMARDTRATIRDTRDTIKDTKGMGTVVTVGMVDKCRTSTRLCSHLPLKALALTPSSNLAQMWRLKVVIRVLEALHKPEVLRWSCVES